MVTTRTAQGDVRGSEHDGILRFAGIPFAAPTDGPRRFRAPEPVEPWTGVRDATAYGPIAPQQDFLSAMLGTEPEPQDEACLFLNVFTPAVDDARRPVMVWIHGGAFVLGSGSAAGYDGSALARRGDVVVVSINYRLGALGFLHLAELDSDYPDSGNLGILDQIAALRWVQENIAAFGGNPDDVTIFGESAGGMSVGTLLGAPSARGLFHKAIPQSGASHNASPASHATEVAHQFLAAAGCADVAELVALPVEQILAAQAAFVMKVFGDVDSQVTSAGNMALPFQPVIDGSMLTAKPIDHVREGNAAGVPVLVGTCRDEWNLFRFMDATTVDDAVLEQRFGKVFGDIPGGAAAAIDVYRAALPGKPPAELFGASVTDLVFRQPAHSLAEALHAHGSPVYSYLFTWESPAMGGILGSCHALEVPFVFGNLDSAGLGFLLGDDPPRSLADRVQAAWLAFVKSGNPSNDHTGDWPAFHPDTRPTMELNEQTAVLSDPESERRQLWQDVLP